MNERVYRIRGRVSAAQKQSQRWGRVLRIYEYKLREVKREPTTITELMWIRLKNNEEVIKYLYLYTCTTITCHCLVGGDDKEDYRKDKHKNDTLCKNNNFREIILRTRII